MPIGTTARPANEPKLRALLVLVIAAAGTLAASEPAKEASPRANLSRDLRQQYPYAPRDAAEKPVAVASGEDVVAMAPFRVFGGYRAVDRAIEDGRSKAKSDAFTPQNGGTILKKEGKRVTTELKIKFNPIHNGFDILSFSW